MRTIKTEELTVDDLPDKRAKWPEIAKFCLTYDFLGEDDGTATGPTRFVDDELDVKKIRRFLYLQQRIINNTNWNPDPTDLARIRVALDRLRELLSRSQR
jgi:hypothetical protein